MATATKTQGKTSFVRKFLQNNRQANVQAVKDAWAASGMEGTIGDTLIYEIRAQMGLSGKAKPRSAAKKKSGSKVSKNSSTPGKKMFVKEFLNDHPQGNFAAVNEAWQAAGFDGTISKAVVDRVRAALGLTGNLRGNTKTTGKKRGGPRKETTAVVNVQPRGAMATRRWYCTTWKPKSIGFCSE